MVPRNTRYTDYFKPVILYMYGIDGVFDSGDDAPHASLGACTSCQVSTFVAPFSRVLVFSPKKI